MTRWIFALALVAGCHHAKPAAAPPSSTTTATPAAAPDAKPAAVDMAAPSPEKAKKSGDPCEGGQ